MKKEIKVLALALLSLAACKPAETKETASTPTTKTTDNQIVKSLGIGLVTIDFDDKTVLNFYAAPDEKSEKKTLEFFDDPAISSWNIRGLDQHKTWLQPEILHLDYSQFILRCAEKQTGWLKVIVNNETGQTMWLKEDKLTIFDTWEAWLKSRNSIGRLPNQPQKIRKAAEENAEEIPFKGRDCFKVQAVQGDWVEITSSENCEGEKLKSGWIKWRAEEKLLVDFFMAL